MVKSEATVASVDLLPWATWCVATSIGNVSRTAYLPLKDLVAETTVGRRASQSQSRMEVLMGEATARGGLPIVVGVDGSPESVVALRWAKKLAGPLRAPIKAISVWHLDMFFGPFAISASDGESIMREVLEGALSEAFGDERPDGLAAECHTGQPKEVLLKASESAQMLIVGSRGHGGFVGLALGSVSSSCAARASCPVLVVRPSLKSSEDSKESGTDAGSKGNGEPGDGPGA